MLTRPSSTALGTSASFTSAFTGLPPGAAYPMRRVSHDEDPKLSGAAARNNAGFGASGAGSGGSAFGGGGVGGAAGNGTGGAGSTGTAAAGTAHTGRASKRSRLDR